MEQLYLPHIVQMSERVEPYTLAAYPLPQRNKRKNTVGRVKGPCKARFGPAPIAEIYGLATEYLDLNEFKKIFT